MIRLNNPLLLIIPVLFFLTSCKVSGNLMGDTLETGTASWYGPGFHGKLTANGEKYDMNGLTAAHRTLPFGTKVKVINQDNGKSVVVRINDRGPYAKGRIIDLSKGAAKKVDMIETGTAKVRLVLMQPVMDNSKITDIKKPHYTIQVASFQDKSLAQEKSSEVKGSRVAEVKVDKKNVYRVYLGKYENKEEATKDLEFLKKKGVSGFVKQLEN